MVRLLILCSSVLIPVIFGAPTVHLQNEYYESASVPSTPDKNTVSLDNRGSFDHAQQIPEKPHIVEPTWITVTMPPVYLPSGHSAQSGQPPIMQPYYTYIPVPPVNQPWSGPWPMYHPPMPVLPPLPSNHLCNQPSNPYRVT